MNAKRPLVPAEAPVSPLLEALDDEPSGIRSVRDIRCDVAIGALGGAVRAGEPVPLYARPYVRYGDARLPFAKDYYLGTRFSNGVIAAEAWRDEMRDDGLPRFMIERCEAYLANHAGEDEGA